MLKDHFLDSTIVVGHLISWDVYYDCSTKYMEINNIRRHTSKRVHEESWNVLHRGRRIIGKYLEEFDKEYRNKKRRFNPIHIAESVRKFTQEFVRKNKLDEKGRNVINNFVERNSTEIKNIILDVYNIEDLKKKVVGSLNSAIDLIDYICFDDPNAKIHMHNCPSNYRSNECDNLYKIINYKPDVLVLLDSHHIKIHHIKNDIYFITTDHEHILCNKIKIESILSGVFIIDAENENLENFGFGQNI